jgi:hypothetical protein
MTDHPDGPVFDVTPFPPTPTKPNCLFVVTNRTTGLTYEVSVTRDAMGFYEMVVNGTDRYPAESQPLYLTIPLLDSTERMLAQFDAEQEAIKHADDVLAALTALAMRSDEDRKRKH